MRLAARAGRIAPSPTLAMAATAKAMAAQGIDVVDFSSGEPDFDTPEPVKAAAEAAIRAGFTKYTPSSGIDELRQAIIDKLQGSKGSGTRNLRFWSPVAQNIHSTTLPKRSLKRVTKSSFPFPIGSPMPTKPY